MSHPLGQWDDLQYQATQYCFLLSGRVTGIMEQYFNSGHLAGLLRAYMLVKKLYIVELQTLCGSFPNRDLCVIIICNCGSFAKRISHKPTSTAPIDLETV